MSDTGSKTIFNVPGYFKSDAAGKRHFAVASALELIAAKVSSSQGSTQLQWEMANLSAYADQIQEALTIK